jgi:N-acetylglutamate synthase-like GNAT family acetyltransferase
VDGLSVRRLEPRDIPECERILSGLAHWFGFEETNRVYIAGLNTLPAFVVVRDGGIAGFVSLRHHNPFTSEIEVLAVHSDMHRQGLGGALLKKVEDQLRKREIRLLEVKTLGPSHADEGYKKTRAFYSAIGFLPLDEINLWGPDQPCLIMVKVLQ